MELADGFDRDGVGTRTDNGITIWLTTDIDRQHVKGKGRPRRKMQPARIGINAGGAVKDQAGIRHLCQTRKVDMQIPV